MKNLLTILIVLFVAAGCSSDDNKEVAISTEVQKPYNPYFINQNETHRTPIRQSGKDSIDFQGTRFVIDDSLSNIKQIEFLGIDTLVFIGDKGKMNNLKSISFSATRLKTLPKDLSDFENLITLNITKSSKLEPFPTSICKLKKLKHLRYAWGRNLDSIPECIGGLKNLEYMDLARNNLTHLPRSISKLKKLKTLILFENPISTTEIDSLKKLLPNTTIYIDTTPYL